MHEAVSKGWRLGPTPLHDRPEGHASDDWVLQRVHMQAPARGALSIAHRSESVAINAGEASQGEVAVEPDGSGREQDVQHIGAAG